MRLKLPYFAGLTVLALLAVAQTATARFFDDFNSTTNWTLTANGGTLVNSASTLVLTAPAGAASSPLATLNATQVLTGSRQSILVRTHTGVAGATAFYFWATDPATGNRLELKLNDQNPTVVAGGYTQGGVYTSVGGAPYISGPDGLYLAFQETNGVTYWEVSSNAMTWDELGTAADPVSTAGMTFAVEHQCVSNVTSASATTVDCFNYMATGAGYHSLQTNTASGGANWALYTEGFNGGNLVCSSAESTHCGITVNGVDASQHFTDPTIPAPYATQQDYNFQIVSTDEPTSRDFDNAYRYQELPYLDADTWTYHLYFKYGYPQYITQGLEFPLNKYTGTNRLQAAVAWYPVRNGTISGEWSVWTGSTWQQTGLYASLATNTWYEITYTAGLHDQKVYYSGFQAGTVGNLTSYAWSQSYAAPSDGTSANIVPAMQIDDNDQDTTVAATEKNCFLAEWNIDWADQKLLPSTPAVLVVLAAPQLIQNIQPSSVTAPVGSAVNLSIQAFGSLPLAYQWFQNGEMVAGATNAAYSFAALAGTNSYFCSVTNAYSQSQLGGAIYSSAAKVVGVAPAVINPANFNSEMQITFAGYNRGELLSDFPVLVRLSTNLTGFSYGGFASATGGDLRFASATGAELPYETDQWNDSNGVSSVWVQMPTLASTNDFIRAYWGNAAATNPPAYTTNGAVWDVSAFTGLPGYDVVYHLKESGFPFFDSTLNYPATNGVAPAATNGVVGNGELFNGASDYLNAGAVTNLNNAFTISAWVNLATNASNIQTICANQKGGYGSAGFGLFVNYYNTANQAVLLDTGDGVNGSELSTAAGVVSYGQWHQITAAVNRTNSTAAFYVDGVYQPTVSGSPVVSDFVNNADLNFGQFTNNNFYLNGRLDEARIHAGMDDSNWVWAGYQTVASNALFQAYSSVTNIVPVVYLGIQMMGGAVVLTWPQGTLQSAGAVGGPYTDLPEAVSAYTNAVTAAPQFFRVRVQ